MASETDVANQAAVFVELLLTHPMALSVIFLGLLLIVCALPGGVIKALVEHRTERLKQRSTVEKDREKIQKVIKSRRPRLSLDRRDRDEGAEK
jgi:hypothetical protein